MGLLYCCGLQKLVTNRVLKSSKKVSMFTSGSDFLAYFLSSISKKITVQNPRHFLCQYSTNVHTQQYPVRNCIWFYASVNCFCHHQLSPICYHKLSNSKTTIFTVLLHQQLNCNAFFWWFSRRGSTINQQQQTRKGKHQQW